MSEKLQVGDGQFEAKVVEKNARYVEICTFFQLSRLVQRQAIGRFAHVAFNRFYRHKSKESKQP